LIFKTNVIVVYSEGISGGKPQESKKEINEREMTMLQAMWRMNKYSEAGRRGVCLEGTQGWRR
jgi:hypothetical protein